MNFLLCVVKNSSKFPLLFLLHNILWSVENRKDSIVKFNIVFNGMHYN